MSGLFGSMKSPPPPPPPPKPQPVAPLPDDQSPDVLEAKRRSAFDLASRAGRASTILTNPNTRGDYSKKTLGGEN